MRCIINILSFHECVHICRLQISLLLLQRIVVSERKGVGAEREPPNVYLCVSHCAHKFNRNQMCWYTETAQQPQHHQASDLINSIGSQSFL